MQRPIPKLQDYGMSPEYGFLPPEHPLARFPDRYFSSWEAIAANLPQLISRKRVRRVVDELPVLSTSKLTTESEWQRAYTVLSFIAHAYIWSDSPPADRLPASISMPWLEVCAHLDMLPTITYAALCLWNFEPLQSKSLDDLDNLVALYTFTGTADESWFHIGSVAVEARGAPMVPKLLTAIAAVRKNDVLALTATLNDVAEILGRLAPLLQRMHEHLSPEVFYNDIRPFISGSRNLPNGIIFDDGSGAEQYHQYGGGSAAQSSLFPFCDIVLGIRHGNPGDQTNSFLEDMRNYMPGYHRKFLQDVAAVANVKSFVQTHEANQALTEAYKNCLEMLRAFRTKHISLVTRYIVLPARAAAKREAGQRAASGEKPEDGAASGTAGAPLIPFLKQMRDETIKED